VAAKLEDFIVRIGGDITALRQAFEQSERRSNEAARKIEGVFTSAGRRITAAFAGIASVATFQRLVSGAVRAGGALTDLAEQSSFSVESIQRLRFAFEQGGTSGETFDASILRLAKNVGEAEGGIGGFAKRLAALDPQLARTVSQASSLEEIFFAVSDAIARTESPAKQAAIATTAFGRGATVMVNTLKQGSEAIRGVGDDLERVGGVISGRAAAALDELGDVTEKAASVFRAQFAEALATSTDGVASFSEQVKDPETLKAIGSLARLVATLASAFLDLAVAAGKAFAALEAPGVGTSEQQLRTAIRALEGQRVRAHVDIERGRRAGDQAIVTFGERRVELLTKQIDDLEAKLGKLAAPGAGAPRPTASPSGGGLGGFDPTGGGAAKAAADRARLLDQLAGKEAEFTRRFLELEGNQRAALEEAHRERLRQLDEFAKKGVDTTEARLAAEKLFAAEVAQLDEERAKAFADLERSFRSEIAQTNENKLAAIAVELEADFARIDEVAKKERFSAEETARLRSLAVQKSDAAVLEIENEGFKKLREVGEQTIGTLISELILRDAEFSFDTLLKSFVATLVQMEAAAVASNLFDILGGGKKGGAQAGGSTGSILGGVLGFLTKAFGFADGAIVTRPTFARIAEGGEAEGVFPLRQLDRFLAQRTPGIEVNIVGAPVQPAGVRQRRGPNGRDILDVWWETGQQRAAGRGVGRAIHTPGTAG